MATEGILETLRARQLAASVKPGGLAKELGLTHAFLSLLFQGQRPRFSQDYYFSAGKARTVP